MQRNSSGDLFEGIYKSLVRPLLFHIDPETAHNLIHRTFAAVDLLAEIQGAPPVSERLAINLCGSKLRNPIGLAAGFDKNGTLIEHIGKLGFGYAEIGSVTAQKTAGNPRPRLFRLPEDEAVINFMGLNGDGAQVVADRLEAGRASLPLSVNIAKTNNPEIVGDRAIEDMLTSFDTLKRLPLVYIALNVSCPNTHEDVLKEMGQLGTILHEVNRRNEKQTPIFLKVSPDSNAELLKGIARAGSDARIAGYICGNTSSGREGLATSPQRIEEIGRGGLSGRPLKSKALSVCSAMYNLKEETQHIIGCGGISNAEDVLDFVRAGASAVQIYTGLVYEGPFLALDITRNLDAMLEKIDCKIGDLVGSQGKLLPI